PRVDTFIPASLPLRWWPRASAHGRASGRVPGRFPRARRPRPVWGAGPRSSVLLRLKGMDVEALSEPVKPEYGGANVCNVVPALLGRRDVGLLPEPVAGARSVVLLVLDGLGWEAIGAHAGTAPTLSSLVGGPVTTVVPSTTPAALTSITTGQPPGRHGVTGYRLH